MSGEESTQTTCEAFTDLLDLYAIGSLDRPEYEALRTHLETGCTSCRTRLDEALLQAALISTAVELVDPPPSLRNRIAAGIAGATPIIAMPQKKRPTGMLPWMLAAAAVVALIAGIGFEESARRKDIASLSASLSSARAEAVRMSQMLNILDAPGTRQVEFNITKPDLPKGRLFIHKNLGVAMLVSHMPAAPEGWKYESWIVPKSGAPQPVESFTANQDGVAITVVKGPVDVTQWSALAVSMEPANSNPVKPGKVLFASPV